MQYYASVVVPKDSPFSRRLLESLKNTAYAIAKIKLKNTIDAEDAKEAIEFFKVHISQHQDAVKVPSSLPDQAAEKIFDKLAVSISGEYYWIDLLDAVCKEDEYISNYIGFDKDGQRNWSINSNKSVRKIRDSLIKLLPAYKDKVELFVKDKVRFSSIHLAWKATYTGGDKGIDIDSIIGRDGYIHKDYGEEIKPAVSQSLGHSGTQSPNTDLGDSKSHKDSIEPN